MEGRGGGEMGVTVGNGNGLASRSWEGEGNGLRREDTVTRIETQMERYLVEHVLTLFVATEDKGIYRHDAEGPDDMPVSATALPSCLLPPSL